MINKDEFGIIIKLKHEDAFRKCDSSVNCFYDRIYCPYIYISGGKMRSFGLWYKHSNESNNIPVFSVHINFWSESVKKDSGTPDLDVGIKIKNFRSVNELIFHCPFVIVEREVKDLASKLCKLENANIVFNTDGVIQAKKPYSVYSFKKNENEENLLLFPLIQDLEGIYYLNEEDNKTDIVFNFSIFREYLKNKNEFAGINEVYIRFRISSAELRNSIYFDCEPSNKSFESAFSGTRIFDFKINEKRNLGSKTIAKIELQEYLFPQIDNIHLLVMEPSSYDVESFANKQMTCRELEGELWDDYFGAKIDYSKDRVLAYHWKFENECSCLIKVKYSKTNVVTLIAYIVMVLALGVLGSTIVAILQSECVEYFPYISSGIGCFLFAIGLFLGRKK